MVDRKGKIMIRLQNASKIFKVGESKVVGLSNVNLTIDQNIFMLIMGPSGCGKTTLLNSIGLMTQLTSGEIFFNDQKVSSLSSRERANFRNKRIGFIFQSYNLLEEFNILDNVSMPMGFAGINKITRVERSRHILAKLGLNKYVNHYPYQLSGGQQQRVAIARALSNDPAIVLADEPTGNLDSTNTIEIMNLLKTVQNTDRTIIMSTHDHSLRKYADVIINMKDGRISEIVDKRKM